MKPIVLLFLLLFCIVASAQNVGIGTSSPLNKLDIFDGTSGSTVVMVRRGVQGSDPAMGTAFGSPYVRIGGVEYLTNSIESIGLAIPPAPASSPQRSGSTLLM